MGQTVWVGAAQFDHGLRAGAVRLLRQAGDVSGHLKDVLASRKALPADGYHGVGHDDGKVSQRPAIYVILTATRVAAVGSKTDLFETLLPTASTLVHSPCTVAVPLIATT